MQKLTFPGKSLFCNEECERSCKGVVIQVLRGILEKKLKGINYLNFFEEEQNFYLLLVHTGFCLMSQAPSYVNED